MNGFNITWSLYGRNSSGGGENKRREFRHRILGVVFFDSRAWGMHPGVISVGLRSCLGREGRVLPRRVVKQWVGGCTRAKIGVWLHCQRFILAEWLMNSSIEGLSGISRLYRVSRVCAINKIRVVEELM